MSGSRWALAAALLALALLLAGPRGAFAHASLLSSEPAAGSVVNGSPPRIHLVFSEPLEPTLGRIAIVGADGVIMPLQAAGDPRNVYALTAPLGHLAAGAYRVVWRIVSADGHPVEGSFTFSVGAKPVPPPPLPDALSAAELSPTWGPSLAGAPLVPSLARGLAVGSLTALAGLLFFLSTPGAGAGSRRTRRLAMVLAFAAPVLLALHLATWLLNASPDHRLGGGWAREALSTPVARVELWRIGLALLSLWALGLARRVRLALGFAAAAVLVGGATGHAAAIHAAWAMPLKALHLAAIAVWLGGILWLATTDDEDPETMRRMATRVSAGALVAVLVVALTGAVQTALFLPSLADLYRTAYGLTTLVKVVGLLALVGYGAHHRFRLLPALGQAAGAAALRRSVRREVLVMLLVVLVGGFLAYVPTPPASADAGATPSHPS